MPAQYQHRLAGSRFVNFGGPGGGGVTGLAAAADTVFSAAIRARFDLVSWDPRGVEYSDPVNCFSTAAASQAYLNSDPVLPYPQTAEPGYSALNAQLGKDCQRRAGTLPRDISSTDTARDLEAPRSAGPKASGPTRRIRQICMRNDTPHSCV